MPDTLISVVQFVNVPALGVVVKPHGVNIRGQGEIPDLILGNNGEFSIAGDDTNVTVTNNSGAPASIDVLCQMWHSIPRAFGVEGQKSLPVRPYILSGDGLIPAAAQRFSPPEKWGVNNIGDGTPATPMFGLVSTNFDDIEMIRGGSIVGLSARLTAALAAGDIGVTVTKNGVPQTLSVAGGAAFVSGRATQAAGIDTFLAGDKLGVEFSTGAGTAPTNADLEAWIDLEF